MPFTEDTFPGREFKTYAEYTEALRLRKAVEVDLNKRAAAEKIPLKITANIVPAPTGAIERRVAKLESLVEELVQKIRTPECSEPTELSVGTQLHGESKGSKYTLEVLREGYLCSDGKIYSTLSGAAFGVSGNRRSGWKFWRNEQGKPAGEMTGRFEVS